MVNSSNSSEPKSKLGSSQQVMRIPTAIIWGASWSSVIAISLMLTVFGLSGLLSPGPEPLETRISPPTSPTSPPQTPQKPPQPEAKEEGGSSLPLWLFVILGLGSAGGSFLVTQVLMRASSKKINKSVRKSSKKVKVPKPKSKQHRTLVTPQHNFHPPRAKRPNKPPKVAVQPQPQPQVRQPDVTILSPEESTPVDSQGQSESLVEIMDLRKRRSLSSLMRNS